MTRGWIVSYLLIPFSVFGQSVMLSDDKLTMECYGAVWEELKERVPTLKDSIIPNSRANNLFLRSDFDCIFPFAGEGGLVVFGIDPEDVVLSEPVNHLGLYLLSNEQQTRSLEEIANDRSVRIASQLGLEKLFQDWKGQIYWVDEMEQVFGMIDLNRVNYIVVTFPDAYADFQQSKLNIAAALVLSTDNLMCKKTNIGMSTVNKINEIIEDMKADGILEEKLGDCFFRPAMAPVP